MAKGIIYQNLKGKVKPGENVLLLNDAEGLKIVIARFDCFKSPRQFETSKALEFIAGKGSTIQLWDSRIVLFGAAQKIYVGNQIKEELLTNERVKDYLPLIAPLIEYKFNLGLATR
jgi:hypothetical protein